MKFPILATKYLVWHYGEALTDWWRIVGNFIWFFFHMFSIGLLLRTLFSPFKRLQEERKKGSWKFENWGGAIIINVLMRLVGFSVRTMFIVVGLIFIIFTAMVGAIAFVFWLILQLIVAFLLVFGFSQLFYLL